MNKNQNFSEICPEKSSFLCNCLKNRVFSEIFLENRHFLPGSTTPQISNQIDAAADESWKNVAQKKFIAHKDFEKLEETLGMTSFSIVWTFCGRRAICLARGIVVSRE